METSGTTETTATMRATMTRAMMMRGARMAGEKVPYHCDDKSQNGGFCVSKLESTSGTCTMLYSHQGRYIFISSQTNFCDRFMFII